MLGPATIYAVLLLASAHLGDAHIAMWNKGLFGYNYPNAGGDKTQNYNTNAVVAPLRQFENLSQAKWFAHGMLDCPPKSGDFMELASGEDYVGELSCNRAWTSMRNPGMKTPMHYYACPAIGPLHTANKFNQTPSDELLGGTALAIAYSSDINTVKPTDFTVIAVNYTSVWTRETVYQIPSGMPECGSEGCLCTWNWIHLSSHGEGYGNEMYNNLYRCKVSGATNNSNSLPLGSATVPKYCSDSSNNCVSGPKQPMYVYQAEGNNMPQPTSPPTYNQRYGFSNGAQQYLFTPGNGAGYRSASTSLLWTLAGTAMAMVIPRFLLQ